jgi:truncated hemoglobin YjbI
MPFRIDVTARDRWLQLMGRAMDECRITGSSREWLDRFYFQVADFMRNQHEQDTEN